MDFQHWALILGTPMVSGLLDYLVNSSQPFSKETLTHAALASLLVGVSVFKSVMSQNEAAKSKQVAQVAQVALAVAGAGAAPVVSPSPEK